MRRDIRGNEERITKGMIIVGIVVIAILSAGLIVYLLNNIGKNTNEYTRQENLGQVEEDDEYKTVSTQMGKKVDEAKNELNNTNTTNNINTNTSVENKTTNSATNEMSNSISNKTLNNVANTSSNTDKTSKAKTSQNTSNIGNNAQEKETDKKQEDAIKFTAPIKGQILREFASDSLVYSDTLQEWITHNGVDVKADKTDVVTAASDGTVFAIKNDPRYGLSVIINHKNGYQTIYANLLTAEFVVEGEEVKQGQTIGTVGNSATFEILDENHLHFEVIKDNEYVNPTNLMSFE